MKVYLLVRESEINKPLQITEKVYTSKEFAEIVCLEANNCNCFEGKWVVRELELDDFKTANEEM